MTKQQKKPEGVLQNVLTYLCFKVNPLSMTKLMKMVYLVDVYYYKTYGKRLMDVDYYHWNYGAWSPKVYITLEQLYDAGIIKETIVTTQRKYKAIIPKPSVNETIIHLPSEVIEILDEVIEDWGSASTDDVVNFTKRTLPFLNTGLGEIIDMSRCDPISVYASEYHIDRSDAATLDIIENKSLMESIRKAIKEAKEGKFLTHKEVFG